MRIAICDDIAREREALIGHLRRFERERRLEFDLSEYESAEKLLADCARGDAPDILFLDIFL